MLFIRPKLMIDLKAKKKYIKIYLLFEAIQFDTEKKASSVISAFI